MQGHQTQIGKNLIDILMFSMYPDAKMIYREYIQNAYDAIIEAQRVGVLSQVKDGQVSVLVNQKERLAQVKDNGIGIPSEQVAIKLLNIADSYKDGVSSAGQYGIGRLVGLRFCDKLIFRTSFKGEAILSEVVFDSQKAAAILQDQNDHRSATEVIDAITTLSMKSWDAEDHHFEVCLEGVKESYSELLSVDIITQYLAEVAPVDYTMIFKNILLRPSLESEEFKTLYSEVKHIQLSVNDNLDVRKGYETKVDGTGDDIVSLEFIKFEDADYGLLAWGWYAITAFTKNIPVSDKKRGIRLRKQNIQIGNADLLNEYFDETRGNNYFYGEIFAVHQELRPTSDRADLAPTPQALRLYEIFKERFKDLKALYHFANEAKSAEKDINYGRRIIDDPTSTDERIVATTKINEGQGKLEKLGGKITGQTTAGQKVLGIYQNRVRQNNTQSSETQSNVPTPTTPPTPTVVSTTVTVVTDILEPLKANMSADELKLVRRIFASLSKNCPAANRELIEKLKKQVVKDLNK